MKYLVIDAALSGTGIRDKYEGGYINPEDLGLGMEIKQKLNDWLADYEMEHYNDFTNDKLVDDLDQRGKEIALMVKQELSEVKIEYFSDARMKGEMI